MLTTNGYPREDLTQLTSREPAAPALRLAVGLGDAERELGLLVALDGSRDLAVVERCLSAEQLLACARRGAVDVLLVARELHRLNGAVLEELAQTGLPLVLLGRADAEDVPRSAILLPPDADAASVREALVGAARGERPRSPVTVDDERFETPRSVAEERDRSLGVLAIASGYGSPGRTTLAVNLAAALGILAPTVLVDGDCAGPSVAAHLDLDPTRNLYMVAHAEPETPRDWERVLAQELQPLGDRCPHGVVLCGVPKPEMRAAVTRRFFDRLIGHLRGRYRYVILDFGADLLGAETALHRTALGLADQVLLVAGGDVVGLWQARAALGLLRGQLGLAPDQIAMVLNRHDARFHHGREEIEWEFQLATAALIPYDHTGSERAIAEHRPMVLDYRSRAGFYLLQLAERVYGGRIELPLEPRPTRRRSPVSWLTRMGRGPAAPAVTTGGPNGHHRTA